jgi:hypothetical protein
MHSSWFRLSFVVAGGTWSRTDGTFWCQEDGGDAGHTLVLAKDEVRCGAVHGSVHHMSKSKVVVEPTWFV